MSDTELQSGDATTETKTENPIDANQETGAELATDTEGQQEPNSQAEDDAATKAAKAQEATQKVINEKHFQAEQAKRDLEKANATIAEFEGRQREAEAAKAGDIPPMPEEFDDNFAEKVAVRDEAIANNARYEASQELYTQQQTLNQNAQIAQQQANYQQARIAYNARATELGISPVELQAAETAVVSYGVTPETAAFIMADKENGPLIVKVLAENAADAISLAGMNQFQQGTFIASLQPKVDALKPRQTNTPKPVDILTGGSAEVDVNKHPNSKGATFS